MAIIYEIKERRVIPNWRDYNRTILLGELSVNNPQIIPVEIDIQRSINDWKQTQNIGTAADLINSSFVSGVSNKQEIDEAINYINTNKSKTSKSLLDLVALIKKTDTKSHNTSSILELEASTIDEFQSLLSNASFYEYINKTKKKTRNEIRNPIVWVELARLHSMKGDEIKAENAMLTALHLAPNNRFVLRSATRFFIHKEKFDKALYYLRKSERTKHDPWLISAHIATSSIMGRFSPLIKDGKRISTSNNFSNFELTELTSSLGTLEFNDGSFKKAKAYFNQSMLAPNDNSLAQIEWISKDDKRFSVNPFQYNNVINPFEARALELFEQGKWNEAFKYSIKWFLDLPFSKRPALLGSYIAGSLIGDKEAAIILCEVGLQANPNDPTLLNNIVYSIASSDDLVLLDKYVKQLLRIDFNSLPNESKITLQATLGLVSIKKDNIETGIQLYELAIGNAKKINNEYLMNLALVNLTRELIKLNLHSKYDKYIKRVKKIRINDNQNDLKLIKEDIIELLKTKPNTVK